MRSHANVSPVKNIRAQLMSGAALKAHGNESRPALRIERPGIYISTSATPTAAIKLSHSPIRNLPQRAQRVEHVCKTVACNTVRKVQRARAGWLCACGRRIGYRRKACDAVGV